MTIQHPTPDELVHADKADYIMRLTQELVLDAQMHGPCQNKIWLAHMHRIYSELGKAREELHTWKEAVL